MLQGSSKILTDFKPHILYENIAGRQGVNLPVAKFLLGIGYELFYYQPFQVVVNLFQVFFQLSLFHFLVFQLVVFHFNQWHPIFQDKTKRHDNKDPG